MFVSKKSVYVSQVLSLRIREIPKCRSRGGTPLHLPPDEQNEKDWLSGSNLKKSKKIRKKTSLIEKGCSHALNVKKVAKLWYVVLKSNYADIIFPLCWVQFC